MALQQYIGLKIRGDLHRHEAMTFAAVCLFLHLPVHMLGAMNCCRWPTNIGTRTQSGHGNCEIAEKIYQVSEPHSASSEQQQLAASSNYRYHYLRAWPELEVKGIREVTGVRVAAVIALYAAALSINPCLSPVLRTAREPAERSEVHGSYCCRFAVQAASLYQDTCMYGVCAWCLKLYVPLHRGKRSSLLADA